MRDRRGFTLIELAAVVAMLSVTISTLVVLNVGRDPPELRNRTICMTNLKSISGALTLYKGTNDNQWPWMSDKLKKWDTTPVGTNRDKDPFEDPNKPGDRSITALPFLLVRSHHPAKLFICPSDRGATKDINIRDVRNASDDEEPDFYWDFSSAKNISYSWQAPIQDRRGKYRHGLSDAENDTVVLGDKTPAVGPGKWDNTAWDPDLKGDAVKPHMSQAHGKGAQVNVLYVGMNVSKSNRPDIGLNHDMIFTASGKMRRGSQAATSVSIKDHRSTRDTFLIGPVPKKRPAAAKKKKGT
jgi:prepilin-type N-terminal cleavage/methylation domain-containing protein